MVMLTDGENESAGKPYRPSNGTEGMVFRDEFCDRCVHDANGDCGILLRSLVFQIGDEDYPKEWTHDAEGVPTCTAFAERAEVNRD